MESGSPAQDLKAKSEEGCLEISLHAAPSRMKTSGDKDIPFSRAILSMRNTGQTVVSGFVPHATLGQEGGSVQDVTGGFSRARTVESIQPGETVEWDVYDQLLAVHAGAVSKVHMFGYRAVLNWWFDLAAWAEYRCSDVATPLHTPVARWRLRWNIASPPQEEVDLTLEVVE